MADPAQPFSLKPYLKKTKIWKSIFRHDFSDTPRTRLLRIFGNVFLHLQPVRVAKDAIRVTYTWGLGGISFFVFLVLCVTGILLMFYYRPASMLAFQDIKDLSFAVTLGPLLRNMHRWAAHLMVVVVIAHMVRVFLTGAYKPPREYNWVIGVILLVMTLFLSYTGYLLPWDQLALWAVTVGAQMAANAPILGNEGPFRLPFITTANDARFSLIGGTVIGDATLIRFYVLHCVAVPFLFCIFLCVHLWRVRKDSFSKQTGEKVDVWPHLVSREFLAALLVLIILFVWSLLMNAPLEAEANLNVTPNPSKAPWYFVGLQELLVYFDPWLAGVVLPTLIVVGLMAIPYVDTNPKGVGYWTKMRRKSFGPFSIWVPQERPFAVSVFMLGTILWFVLIFIGTYCRGPNWEWYWPWEPWSYRRLTKLTLKNIPNLWGGLLVMSYVAMGTPLPAKAKELIAAKAGPKTPGRLFALLHLGLGMMMSVCLFVPLLISKDADYPLRSRYTTLFEALGRSINAPVMSNLYHLFQQAGPAVGSAVVGVMILVVGLILGRIGIAFGKMKNRMFDELGLVKYAIVISLLLMMMGVLGKIMLRLLFGIKYLISLPMFNFNI
ncbi:MAG: cytochrome b N-terminal domain-containing protein [Candidatus Omnitrophica bacterium]|nr:cytochrome b N-terminal domain-containing protein [Candidatus Omnitrophota bacterium]